VAAPSPGDVLGNLPEGLRTELLNAFNEIVRNFRESQWEPSELNGGKFSEVVYSILKGYTEGKFPKRAAKPRNMVDACKDLEKATGFPRSARILIPRMLLGLYEVRNNRNVGHVGGDVDPNHMDAVCVLSMAKWILAELIRVFHATDTDEATAAVEALTEREIPVIWQVGEKRRVLRTDLSVHDKMMLLVYSSPGPVTDDELLAWLEYGNVSRFKRSVLQGAHDERLLEYDASTGSVEISPRGAKYVEENLPLVS
jgi:hypothetical protein